jgi:hypothetical protein
MKTCRKNLDKLKQMCDELGDRDDQLKINASTLWLILEKIESIKSKLSCLQAVSTTVLEDTLESSILELKEISDLVVERGCKRISND